VPSWNLCGCVGGPGRGRGHLVTLGSQAVWVQLACRMDVSPVPSSTLKDERVLCFLWFFFSFYFLVALGFELRASP
jgi:hypothetical protein